jgi:hypothetical protein
MQVLFDFADFNFARDADQFGSQVARTLLTVETFQRLDERGRY